MEIKPFKMKVTPKQSVKVQEILFKNGYEWHSGEIKILHKKNFYLYFQALIQYGEISPSLFTDFTNDGEEFDNDKLTEVTFEEFIKLYGGNPVE